VWASRPGALEGYLLVEAVAKLEVVRRGLDGRLVDHAVALQRVNVADPDAATGLEDGKEQRSCRAQLLASWP
jgi:hypothetical protein